MKKFAGFAPERFSRSAPIKILSETTEGAGNRTRLSGSAFDMIERKQIAFFVGS